MSAISILLASSGFTPVTRTYSTGTAATETVPAGATSVTIRNAGGGGSGGHDSTIAGGGGGSGGYSTKPIAVTGGNTFTYTVGQGGVGVADGLAGNAGTASTVSGTPSGGAVSLTANGGGAGGLASANGAGGTASGGTTNTTGNAGSGITGGAAVYLTYGAGGNGKNIVSGLSTAGGSGVVIFEYT